MHSLRSILYILGCIVPASAGVLSNVSVYTGTSSSNSALCSNNGNAPGEVLTTCSNTLVTGLAKADSNYGVLKAYASYAAVNAIEPYASVTATSFFNDNLHFTSSGAPSTIEFTFSLTGSGFSGTGASLNFSISGPGGPPLTVTSPGGGPYTFTRPWMEFFALQASLLVRAEFDNVAVGPWSNSGVSDFYSTGTLTAIEVFDAEHNNITNTVTLDGALTYPLGGGGGGAVPEPSTMLLTAGGAAIAVLIRKRLHA